MIFTSPVLQPPKIQEVIELKLEKPVEAPKEKLYKIVEQDTLTKIASDNHTTVQRLFSKNTSINDPNVIEVGVELVIPAEDEQLADRPMPAIVEAQPTTLPSAGGVSNSGRSSVSGNLYSPGYCTWYVKNQRPDLPNNLGNADTWYYRYGGAKGETPAVGAVAVAKGYMHVAIVTAVHGDSITISEMNYKGLYVVSEREAPVSEFHYIY